MIQSFGASPSLSKSTHAKSKDEEDEEEVENHTNDNPSRSRSQRCHMAAMAFSATHLPSGFQVMNARGKKAFRDPTKASMPHGISSDYLPVLNYYHYHQNDSLEVTRQDHNYWKRNLIQPNPKKISKNKIYLPSFSFPWSSYSLYHLDINIYIYIYPWIYFFHLFFW